MRSSIEISEILTDLENPRKDLTNWEKGFLESLADQFDRTGSLTDSTNRNFRENL